MCIIRFINFFSSKIILELLVIAPFLGGFFIIKFDKAGEYMPLEAIKVVVAAESDAESLRVEALAEAKRIIAAADVGGREEIQKARKAAEAKVQALCREAEEQGKDGAAKSLEEVRDKCLTLEKEAEKRMNQAVAIIVERVVNGQ